MGVSTAKRWVACLALAATLLLPCSTGTRSAHDVVGVPVGATAAAAAPSNATCPFAITSNQACSRNPIASKTVKSVDECCAACIATPSCTVFTYHSSGGSCDMTTKDFYTPTPKSGDSCGIKNSGPSPPGPAPPGPSPSPYPPRHDVDCGLRALAATYGMALVGGIHQDSLVEALQIGEVCPDLVNTSTLRAEPLPQPQPRLRKGGDSFWVSPSGSDANPGTQAQPWKTLARTLKQLELHPPAQREMTTFHILEGTYNLDAPLSLQSQHSGKSSDAPVIFQAEGVVNITGGPSLGTLAWSAPTGAAGVRTVALPNRTAPLSALYVDGVRQFRSRFPNGNPEHYCPRDLHGGQCPGFAQAGTTVTTGALPKPTPVAPPNVNVYDKGSGTLLATGLMQPFSQQFRFDVPVPSAQWAVKKLSFANFLAYEGGAANRYDLSNTFAYWASNVPLNMSVRKPGTAGGMSAKAWANPSLAVLHTYQSAYWGSWQFQLEAVDIENQMLHFSKGGFQEARGGTIGGSGQRGEAQDYFVENVFEELDVAREFYWNASTRILSWFPDRPVTSATTFEAPTLETVVAVQGASPADPVANVQFQGLTFQSTVPTFLAPYEPTSGGDWAVHRGAAVFVENATNITFSGCKWVNVEGNALMLSKTVKSSTVTRNEFFSVGETPIVLLGAADLMDLRNLTVPYGNEISHNYVHQFGIWNRQAAGYFEGLACHNNVSYNVFHDGPRAGANFNDDSCGGLVFEGNLLFNVVQDTGEHGSTNSWGRQPFVRSGPDGPLLASDTKHIRRNFVFRNSFRGPSSNKWCLDKDDGSSNYLTEGNVLVYGAIKARDGKDRYAHGNLFLYPDKYPFEDTTNTKCAMAFQVNGFDADTFVNNTVISDLGLVYMCAAFKEALGYPTTGNNTFITPGDATLPFKQEGCGPDSSYKAWTAAGHDAGTRQDSTNLTAAELLSLARSYLPSGN